MQKIKLLLESSKHQISLSKRQKIILEILALYNCRISEVLSATLDNYFPDRFLILKGKKKSSDIIITDRKILSDISQLNFFESNKIFDGITYLQMYRIIKRDYSHLFANFRKKKNAKITHGFRYLNILGVQDEKSIKSILHHNSIDSQKYYKLK
ncbi:MAG: site-specific integrase [Melioribacteraceae bacterium]|nr:site-specific integrase [Melioribacteraceae bacterium]